MRKMVALVLVGLLLCSGTLPVEGDAQSTRTPPPPPRPDVDADGFCHNCINYRVDPKFGLDENNNGIIDLPNSREYVTRPLRVTVGASFQGGFWVEGRDWHGPSLTLEFRPYLFPSPTEGYTVLELTEKCSSKGKWVCHFDESDLPFGWSTRVRVEDLVPEPTPAFTLAKPDGGTLVIPELREGQYKIQVTRTGGVASSDSPYEGDGIWTVMTVHDILIASLGDSYSSGEGNPEFMCVYGVQVDPDWRERCALRNTVWAEDGQSRNFFPAKDRTIEAFRQWSKENKMHHTGHRSTFAWPAQLALLVEESDDHSAVTFVHLAQSGATIRDGVAGPYRGRDEPWLPLQDRPNQVQVFELQRIVGPREIDALLISIGGNDIGFGRALSALLLSANPSTVETAVRSGRWTSLSSKLDSTVFCALTDDCKSDLPGMSGLPAEYDRLQETIDEYLWSGVKKTYLLQYPTFWKEPKAGRDRPPKAVVPDDWMWESNRWAKSLYKNCDKILDDVIRATFNGYKPQITASGSATIGKLAKKMDDVMARSAQDHGWVFIGDVGTVTQGHGYCLHPSQGMSWQVYDTDRATYDPRQGGWVDSKSRTPVPYFVTADQSIQIQGPHDLIDKFQPLSTAKTVGTAHPNWFGHAAISRRALAHLDLPDSYASEKLYPRDREYWAQQAHHTTFDTSRRISTTVLEDRLVLGTSRNIYSFEACRNHPFAIHLRESYELGRALSAGIVRVFDVEWQTKTYKTLVRAGALPTDPDRILTPEEIMAAFEAAVRDPSIRFAADESGIYYVGISGGARMSSITSTGGHTTPMLPGNPSYNPWTYGPDATGDWGAYLLTVASSHRDTDGKIWQANPVAIGQEVTGHCLELPSDVDMFKFTAKAGQRIAIEIDKQPLVLRVFDEEGSEAYYAQYGKSFWDGGLSVGIPAQNTHPVYQNLASGSRIGTIRGTTGLASVTAADTFQPPARVTLATTWVDRLGTGVATMEGIPVFTAPETGTYTFAVTGRDWVCSGCSTANSPKTFDPVRGTDEARKSDIDRRPASVPEKRVPYSFVLKDLDAPDSVDPVPEPEPEPRPVIPRRSPCTAGPQLPSRPTEGVRDPTPPGGSRPVPSPTGGDRVPSPQGSHSGPRPVPPPTGGDRVPVPCPALAGFDLQLENGTTWHYYWSYTRESSTSTAPPVTETGSFRVILGEGGQIGGVQVHPVQVDGETSVAGVDIGPRWKYLGFDDDVLVGSTNGVRFAPIVSGSQGDWNGHGFFTVFANQDSSYGHENATNRYLDTESITVRQSVPDDKCIRYPVLDTLVCGKNAVRASEAAPRGTTVSESEHYKSGLGPIAYNLEWAIPQAISGARSRLMESIEVGLVDVTIDAPDHWTPNTTQASMNVLERITQWFADVLQGIGDFFRDLIGLERWELTVPMPVGRADATAEEVDGSLYVFGRSPQGFTVESFDPATGAWTPRASLSPGDVSASTTGRHDTVVIGDKVHLVDGTGRSWVYDPATDSWAEGPAVPALFDGIALSSGDVMLLAGSKRHPGDRATRTVIHTLDPQTGERKQEDWLLDFNGVRAAALHEGSVYLFGGKAREQDAWLRRVDLAKGGWAEKATLPDAPRNAGFATHGSKLYLVGGEDAAGIRSSVAVYDAATDTWSMTPEMNFARTRAAVAVVQEQLHVVGGTAGFDALLPTVEVLSTQAKLTAYDAEQAASADEDDDASWWSRWRRGGT